ncbi:MAG: hypothetical protein JWP79_1998, partial [Polaromonas sp.]|nr:hypothetical protein [Polaromonas sp.]
RPAMHSSGVPLLMRPRVSRTFRARCARVTRTQEPGRARCAYAWRSGEALIANHTSLNTQISLPAPPALALTPRRRRVPASDGAAEQPCQPARSALETFWRSVAHEEGEAGGVRDGSDQKDPCLSPQGEFGSFPTQPVLRREAPVPTGADPLSATPFLVTFCGGKKLLAMPGRVRAPNTKGRQTTPTRPNNTGSNNSRSNNGRSSKHTTKRGAA